MDKNGNVGSQIFSDVFNSSAGVLVLSGADLVLLILAFVFVGVGSVQLRRNAQAVGAQYMLIALVAFIFGFAFYGAYYLLLTEEAPSPLIDAFFGFFTSACAAAGAYGFLRLCGSLKK